MTSSTAPHSVALSWNASTSLNIVSFSLYRSTMQGASCGLASSAIGGLTYRGSERAGRDHLLFCCDCGGTIRANKSGHSPPTEGQGHSFAGGILQASDSKVRIKG